MCSKNIDGQCQSLLQVKIDTIYINTIEYNDVLCLSFENYSIDDLLFENKHNIQNSNTANLETNILFFL